MASKQFLATVSHRTLNGWLAGGVAFCGALWLILRAQSDASTATAASARLFAGLGPQQVVRLDLAPYDMDLAERQASGFRAAATLTDSSSIRRVLYGYQTAFPYHPGDGRLPGTWRARVVFRLRNGQAITSYVYHTAYADLLFIPTIARPTVHGLNDLLASRTLASDISRALQGP